MQPPVGQAAPGLRGRAQPPHEHYGCFSYGDLDGFLPLLPLKSLYLSLKLILGGLILLDLTLRLPYLPLSLKRIMYQGVLGRGYHQHWFPFWCSGHGSTRDWSSFHPLWTRRPLIHTHPYGATTIVWLRTVRVLSSASWGCVLSGRNGPRIARGRSGLGSRFRGAPFPGFGVPTCGDQRPQG